MNFVTTLFAVAGLIAATGPLLIHLLNRRRFRTVNWAAMDFLRQAMQRNRRMFHLRDLLLLILRILAVACFGFALARPYMSNLSDELTFRYVWLAVIILIAFGLAIWAVLSSEKATKLLAGGLCLGAVGVSIWSGIRVSEDRAALVAEGTRSLREPIHAVMVIDNSLSMGCESLEGTFLDRAKAKATSFIEELPPQSRVSVIPLCGSEHAFSLDAYRSKEDALEAVDLIEVVDRAGSTAQALDLAAAACEKVPELTAKRVVLLSDQQSVNWPVGSLKAEMNRLPELQVVQIGGTDGRDPENVWISDFRVQDGIADIETPTNFLVAVDYQGKDSLTDAQVTLVVDGITIASQTIDLEPGQSRQLEFQYQIDIPAEPGQPKFVPARVNVAIDSVRGDSLKNDNERFLSVPVVAGLPVVFVDQFGTEEKSEQRGETYRLRRLLAPQFTREEFQKQLIVVRHTTIEKLDEEILRDARLVVIAGVETPEPAVGLLREYVLQGGQLVIATGADFDSEKWNKHAWLDGGGILPAPLNPTAYGVTPLEATEDDPLQVYRLDWNSMFHDYFLIEGEPKERLQDLYNQALFFKSAAVEISDDIITTLLTEETKRIAQTREQILASEKQRENWNELERKGLLGETEEALQQQDLELRKHLEPNWLLWSHEESKFGGELPANELAERSRPRVLARYQGNNLPFLLDRRIGQGQVMFFSSAVYSEWNTITNSTTILMFDRILRRLLEETLPQRTFDTGSKIVLPADGKRQQEYLLKRPSGFEENLPVQALGSDVYGVTIPQALASGIYQVSVTEQDSEQSELPGEKVEEFALVINGPAYESDLTTVGRESLEERLGQEANYRWLTEQEEISLEGAQIRGRDLWKILAMIVLGCLVLEMLLLAWPMFKKNYLHREATP